MCFWFVLNLSFFSIYISGYILIYFFERTSIINKHYKLLSSGFNYNGVKERSSGVTTITALCTETEKAVIAKRIWKRRSTFFLYFFCWLFTWRSFTLLVRSWLGQIYSFELKGGSDLMVLLVTGSIVPSLLPPLLLLMSFDDMLFRSGACR